MKAYRFIFLIGFLNLTVPFLGVPFVYKNYALISLAVITLGYALIVRTIEKEKENNFVQDTSQAEVIEVEKPSVQKRKIEDVVEMNEKKEHIIVSDVVVKPRGRRPKVLIQEQVYE